MTTYLVNDIYPSIQGEGQLTGTPMFVLRMQGCGVGCPWCDTKETWHRDAWDGRTVVAQALGRNRQYMKLGVDELLGELRRQGALAGEWILLTGGEPAEQELAQLLAGLRAAGYRIAIETSGTASLDAAALDWLCVSPKANMPGGRWLQLEVLAAADELKFVIGRPQHVDGMLVVLDMMRAAGLEQKAGAVVSLQPLSLDVAATRLCHRTARELGFVVSHQMHHYLDIP